MESNSQINELIVRSLMNDLNEEEHALVVAWINASEENRRYFIQIRDTWQLTAVKLTAQVNEEEEWRLFLDTIAARDANVVSIRDEEERGNALTEEEGRTNKAVIYRRLLRMMVAAAVIILVGLGWMYFLNGDQQPAVATKPLQKVDGVIPVIQRETNTAGKERSITLADGSMVVLFDNSELMYEKHFINRHIKLTGKAFFKVAKDAGRPFTVESEGITVTALGTEFTVNANAFAKQKQVIVKLYEGKVVVKPVAANRLMKSEVYLLPGQELVYGPNTTTVQSFVTESKSPVVKKEEEETPVADNPTLPVNTKGSWHMYNNQALSQVLDHLAVTYGVSIVYNAKDVQQKYFVGQFKTTDSIEMILILVTKATKLKYTREGNTFIIHQ
jgi:ferric-dicitrate binding protein FerR (iron transport regulator)